MMKTKTLGLLILAILLMSMLVFFNEGQRDVDEQLGRLALPGLKESREKLEEINIASSDMETTLIPVNDHWGVKERDGYPVNFDQLIDLLDALSDATYEEKKTSKPENLGVLELQDVDHESSKAVLVRAVAQDKTFELLVGAGASGRNGQFVRHAGDDQAWLVDRPIDVAADPSDWLDPVILNIPEEDIVRIRQGSGDNLLEAERLEGVDSLTVSNLPEGRELRYPTVADGLARALTNVRLTDVAPRTGKAPDDTTRAWFELADGGKIQVNAWEEEGDNFVVFDLEGVELPSEHRRIEAWTYQVGQSTLDKFTRTMEDMIKAEEEQGVETGE